MPAVTEIKSIPAVFITVDGASKAGRVDWPPRPRIYFAIVPALTMAPTRFEDMPIPQNRCYELERVEYGGPLGGQDPEHLRALYREAL